MLSVKEMRKNIGCNQAQFSGLIGFSQPTISRWEREGTPEAVLKLLNLLYDVYFGQQLSFDDFENFMQKAPDHSSQLPT